MAKQDGYESRPGAIYEPCEASEYPDIIFYSHNGWGSANLDGHFARVTDWTNGLPIVIISKWNNLELIESTNANPFDYTGDLHYGASLAYYKLAGS